MRHAKAKAKDPDQALVAPHKDNLFEVEKAIDVTSLMQAYGYFLRLTQATKEKPFTFVCKYLPIA